MRKIVATLLLSLILILASCNAATVDGKQLVERNDVVYKVNEDKPFSGLVANYWGEDKKIKQHEFKVKNGKINGKYRSWYDNGQLQYESNYQEGLLSGKYISYYRNGQKESEGIYVNNLKEGKWTEWNSDSQLLYDGEYKLGNKSGFGKSYASGHLIYEGSWVNGKKEGSGKVYHNGEVVFTGDFKDNNYWNGNGKKLDKDQNIEFEGQFKEGKPWTGKGNLVNQEKQTYQGEILEGKYDGTGKLINNQDFWSRETYEGQFKNGQKNGQGRLFKKDKVVFEGEFKDDQYFNGISNEVPFVGEFKDGKYYNGKHYYDKKGDYKDYYNEYRNGEKIATYSKSFLSNWIKVE